MPSFGIARQGKKKLWKHEVPTIQDRHQCKVSLDAFLWRRKNNFF